MPIKAERSEKKALNEDRLRKIAVEASEQSGRGDVPDVSGIQSLHDAVKGFKTTEKPMKLVAFHTEGVASRDGQHVTVGDRLKTDIDHLKPSPVAVFIGPEGGWSPAEIDLFHKEGIEIACLGPQVLRSETAVVAALSVVVFG